jgi:hypothetical protein
MDWVRIHPMIANWPGGGPPPTFDISADENGTAVVELAWDPQALAAPSAGYVPLRYYNSGSAYNVTYTADGGASRNLSVPAQNIQLSGNRAAWTIPQALWDAYIQESLKTLNRPPTTTFARNLYYRVRATAPGASQATIWPSNAALAGQFASAAPHIGILPISASPSSQVAPDQAAVAAMGGLPFMPTFWSDLLLSLWRSLPESDPNRQVLVRIFAHQAFQGASLATRAAMLKLWLIAGPTARGRLPQLLDRNAVVGSNVIMPIISKTDLRGGKTLVENLLDLQSITPHPDLSSVTVKEHLLDDVITEILDPNGQVNQGAAGTCSPTSLQTLLITINPAEYARLQVGWLSSAGQATLANNAIADVPVSVFKIANYANVAGQPFLMRTFSELAFQTAILKYAQGSSFPAFTGTPQNINQIFQATIAGGLSSDQTKRALDGIFNVNFTTRYISYPINQTNASWTAAQVAIRDGLVRDLPGRQQQTLMAMFWSQPYNFGHVLMGVRRDGGRIFFKNPQYPGSNPTPGIAQGGNGTNPPRRYEDPSQSLESISEADLATWIKGYWTPDTAIL